MIRHTLAISGRFLRSATAGLNVGAVYNIGLSKPTRVIIARLQQAAATPQPKHNRASDEALMRQDRDSIRTCITAPALSRCALIEWKVHKQRLPK
jgi:hypothetical protein